MKHNLVLKSYAILLMNFLMVFACLLKIQQKKVRIFFMLIILDYPNNQLTFNSEAAISSKTICWIYCMKKNE